MIGQISAIISLTKEIRSLLLKPPDGINFNIVMVKPESKLPIGSHLRIINLLPIPVNAVSFGIQKGDNQMSRVPIDYIYHMSSKELPFGKKVTYRIKLDQGGVFLYPESVYYVPLSEYENIDWKGDVRVIFTYMQATGVKNGNLQKANVVEVM
jgi:hypothetical protein